MHRFRSSFAIPANASWKEQEDENYRSSCWEYPNEFGLLAPETTSCATATIFITTQPFILHMLAYHNVTARLAEPTIPFWIHYKLVQYISVDDIKKKNDLCEEVVFLTPKYCLV
jgi:hypothetical protein